MARILHGDWSKRLGENRSDQPLKYLAAMLPGTSRMGCDHEHTVLKQSHISELAH